MGRRETGFETGKEMKLIDAAGGHCPSPCPFLSSDLSLSVYPLDHANRQCYAVSTAREVTVWRVQHDLEYNILRGGHEKAVISLYACAGGTGATPGEQDYRWVGGG